MVRPLVTIVLPIWKDSLYLQQAVESCRSQSYQHLELILVDDGCSRVTQALLEACARDDERIRIVTHGENRGLPAALNTGFAAARGQYLTWTSDDNQYRPAAIQTMVEELEAHPGVDIVYSDIVVVDAEDRVVRRDTAGDYRELISDNCVRACFLYRRAVQQILGGYAEDLFLAEDYDFWLRASIRFRMLPIHQDLYVYREHRDSLTSTNKAKQQVAAGRCLERNLPHLAWASAAEKAVAYLSWARAAQLGGDWGGACRRAWWAVRLAPLRTIRTVAGKTFW